MDIFFGHFISLQLNSAGSERVWFFPVRESLGAALVMNGDDAGAEKVFREDLDHHPRNPRSLFGLQQALKAQGKEYDAGFVQKQLQASWKGRNTQLKLDDLV